MEGFEIVDADAFQYAVIAWIAGLAIFLQMAHYAPEMSWDD